MKSNEDLARMLIPSQNRQRGLLHATRAAIGSLPMVARALLAGSTKKLRIVHSASANTGSTDCNTIITLPALPLPRSDADLDTMLISTALAYGLLHHEVGHCNHSDIDVIRATHSELERTILNIVEDVRMENVHIARFPGSRRYLDAMNWAMWKQGNWAIYQPGQASAGLFFNYLMSHLNGVYRKDPPSLDILPALSQEFKSRMGNELQDKLDTVLLGMERLTCSADALVLTREVIALLQDHSQQMAQQKASQRQIAQAQSGPQDAPEQVSSSDTDDASTNRPESGQGPSQSEQEQKQGKGQGQGSQDPTDPQGDEPAQQGDLKGDHAAQDADVDDHSEEANATLSSTGQGSNDGDDGDDGDASDGRTVGQPSQGNRGIPAGQDVQGQESTVAGRTGQPGQSVPTDDAGVMDDTASLQEILQADFDPSADKHHAAQALLETVIEQSGVPASLDVAEQMELLDLGRALHQHAPSDQACCLDPNMSLDEAYQVSAGIRRRLQAELDAFTHAERWVGRRGRRLSSRHLPGVVAGDPNVFETTTDGEHPDTAILLVLDHSGSMAGRQLHVACNAVYAAALALEAIEGVDVAAMAFPSMDRIVQFGRSPRGCPDRFKIAASGSTPLTEAVYIGAQALLDQPRKRRLMVVMSDGDPDDSVSALGAIAAAEQMGIEMMGVGIFHADIRKLFDRSEVICDLTELPGCLVKLVRDEVMLSMTA